MGWPRTNNLNDLECTQNRKLIQLALDTSIDIANDLTAFERFYLIQNMGWENFEGYKAVIEFIEANHEVIKERWVN
jgi:hypothetical protein